MRAIETELLIIGGGINGISTARMAAANDIDCILIEQSDLCSGTSNASSKLIHGGLRYLEQYDFGLVHEAAVERKRLLQNAPHLVKEQRFIFPHCEQNQHGRFATKLGISLYEILAGKYSLEPHQFISEDELHELEPQFLPQESISAYQYSDCNMDDAALAIAAAIDAEDLGATIYNYHKVISLRKEISENTTENPTENNKAWICTTQDQMSSGEDLEIRAQKVALNLGPWTDYALKQWGIPSPQLVQLSQGAHLFVKRLPISTSFILPVPRSNRYFFILPWKSGHLIGTTETAILTREQIPAKIQPQEIGELLYLVSTYFPHLEPEIICTIAGIRPLAIEDPSSPNLQSTSSIKTSRQHLFHQLGHGLCAGVGGKWTTHRTFSIEHLQSLGYQIERDLSNRSYPATPLQSDATLEEKIFYSIQHGFCKHPLDFIRNRSDYFWSEDAGSSIWPQVLDQFQKHFPKESPSQWNQDYLNYLKRNQHQEVQT